MIKKMIVVYKKDIERKGIFKFENLKMN